ncbi:MAG: ferredoxin family protein [Anaerolineales bacterium]|jgi:2-oxoglutarate ferredoxin oxidoreductase subunit delta
MRVFARKPLDSDSVSLPRGQVYLIPVRCKGCGLCIEFCPQGILQESINTNQKGYHYPEVIIGGEQECVNCEFCTLICPEFAIFTLPVSAGAG